MNSTIKRLAKYKVRRAESTRGYWFFKTKEEAEEMAKRYKVRSNMIVPVEEV